MWCINYIFYFIYLNCFLFLEIKYQTIYLKSFNVKEKILDSHNQSIYFIFYYSIIYKLIHFDNYFLPNNNYYFIPNSYYLN